MFGPTAASEARDALRDGRLVFFTAPRRTGLSYQVRSVFGAEISDGRLRCVSLPRSCTVEQLRSTLALALQLPGDLADVRDLQGASFAGSSQVVLIENVHRLAPVAREWILRALLDRVHGDSGRYSFVLEGAVDFDRELSAAFPGGLMESPCMLWAEPGTPWNAMTSLESYLGSRPRTYPAQLMAWCLDYAGGDLSAIGAFVEKLGDPHRADGAAVAAAWKYVEERSAVSREIRECVSVSAGRAIVESMLHGATLSDLPPRLVEAENLRDLFLAGIITHDSVMSRYQISSPLVGRVVASALGMQQQDCVHLTSIHARTSFLVWRIAALETQLRSLLRSEDCVKLAADTRMEAPWAGVLKTIRGRAAQDRGPDFAAAVGAVIKAVAPEHVSISDAIAKRSGHTSGAKLTEYATFAELVALLGAAKQIGSETQQKLQSIARTRNEVAHFRGVDFDHAIEFERALTYVLTALGTAGTPK